MSRRIRRARKGPGGKGHESEKGGQNITRLERGQVERATNKSEQEAEVRNEARPKKGLQWRERAREINWWIPIVVDRNILIL